MTKRVGVLVPSTNTVVEAELARHLSNEASVHAARMFISPGVAHAEEIMLDRYLPDAARDLAGVRPDVVVFACTTAGALRGSAYETKLVSDISAATGAPTISIMGSVVDELRRRNARRIGVLTPYSEEANRSIERALVEAGIEVAAIAGLGVKGAFEIAEVSPEQLIAFGHEILDGLDIDLVFISCANLYTLDHMTRFEAEFGRPVISSLSAALSAVNRQLSNPVASAV